MAKLRLEDWFPMSPLAGPPLPRWMGTTWPWYKKGFWVEERVDFREDGKMRFVWAVHNETNKPVTIVAIKAHREGRTDFPWDAVLPERNGWTIPAGVTNEWAYGWVLPSYYGYVSGRTSTDFFEVKDSEGNIYKTKTITFQIP